MNRIEEVLRLDKEATQGPWLYMNSEGEVHPVGTTSEGYYSNHGIGVAGDTDPSILGCDEYHIFGDNTADVELILAYRTAAPKLARALKVAMGALQEALRQAEMYNEDTEFFLDSLTEVEAELR